jgi:hypothetical protein
VRFPATRRKALFGETPNNTRETHVLPRRCGLSVSGAINIAESIVLTAVNNRMICH